MSVDKTITKAALILEYLYEDDFKAKSVSQISVEFGIPGSTVYRILRSWKEAGWVIETPAPTGKGVLWMISRKVTGIAHAFERGCINEVREIKDKYQSVTGKELQV